MALIRRLWCHLTGHQLRDVEMDPFGETVVYFCQCLLHIEVED
jgi:hypothetical protein